MIFITPPSKAKLVTPSLIFGTLHYHPSLVSSGPVLCIRREISSLQLLLHMNVFVYQDNSKQHNQNDFRAGFEGFHYRSPWRTRGF